MCAKPNSMYVEPDVLYLRHGLGGYFRILLSSVAEKKNTYKIEKPDQKTNTEKCSFDCLPMEVLNPESEKFTDTF